MPSLDCANFPVVALGSLRLKNHYRIECFDRDGREKWVEEIDNIIPAQGLTHILAQFLKCANFSKEVLEAGTLTNPFSTVNTDNTVTVADTSHGLKIGDWVYFNASATVGGLDMDGTWVVATVPDANSITFEHTSAATSTAGPGGGATEFTYDNTTWHVGLIDDTNKATLSNPFDTVNTDETVTVNHTAHGAVVGDTVHFTNADTVGGIDPDGAWQVATVVDANSYTFEHTSAATSTVSGGGGATVGYRYLRASDTAAQISATAAGTNWWAEMSEYDEATRPLLLMGTPSAGSVSNTANKAVHTISATKTALGIFVASSNVKDGTAGIMYGEAFFTSARNLEDDDTLNVTITSTQTTA